MRSQIPYGPSSLAIGSRRPYADLNSVFHSLFSEVSTPRRSRQTALRADIHETEDAYELQAELPGVRREDFELKLLDDVLTLSGSFGSSEPEASLRSGSFQREFQLSGPVDSSAIRASHIDGLLRVQLPKAASAKPQKIEVQVE